MKGGGLEQYLDKSSPLADELAKNYIAAAELDKKALPRTEHPVVVAVVNQKGGVGKTTSAVNIAAALALGGLKVVVIDTDPQGNASTALGITHEAGTPSTYEVLIGERDIRDVLQPCPNLPNLLVSPATIDLAGAELELVDDPDRAVLLRGAIDDLLNAEDRPDVVIIDCPPSLTLLTLNALVASDTLLVPVQAEYYALEGLSMLMNTVDMVRTSLNAELLSPHILITMYDGRTRLSAEVAAEVREHFADQVLETTIGRSVRVSEAPSYNETVVTYDPRGSGAVAYREAARELAERFVEEEATNG